MKDENAEELRQILLEAVRIQEVSLGRRDEFGQRYISSQHPLIQSRKW